MPPACLIRIPKKDLPENTPGSAFQTACGRRRQERPIPRHDSAHKYRYLGLPICIVFFRLSIPLLLYHSLSFVALLYADTDIIIYNGSPIEFSLATNSPRRFAHLSGYAEK